MLSYYQLPDLDLLLHSHIAHQAIHQQLSSASSHEAPANCQTLKKKRNNQDSQRNISA